MKDLKVSFERVIVASSSSRGLDKGVMLQREAERLAGFGMVKVKGDWVEAGISKLIVDWGRSLSRRVGMEDSLVMGLDEMERERFTERRNIDRRREGSCCSSNRGDTCPSA